MISGKATRSVIWAIVGLLLLPVPVALANSGPPPTTIWLTLDSQAEVGALEGMQLIGCEGTDCAQPTLLQQFGRCDGPECLDATPVRRAAQPAGCQDNRCLFRFYEEYPDSPAIRIVAQFADGVRISPAFAGGALVYETVAWRVAVGADALSISEDEGFQRPFVAYGSFILYMALTIVAELLVAALALLAWRKRGAELLKGLACVALANLVSYPVTWYLWPSLRQFQPGVSRTVGYIILALALLAAALLVLVATAQGRKRLAWAIVGSILLLGAGGVGLIWLFLASYADSSIAIRGLPAGVSDLLAEAFAIAFETALVYLLARRALSLSLKLAALLSLLMNVASYLLGRLVLG